MVDEKGYSEAVAVVRRWLEGDPVPGDPTVGQALRVLTATFTREAKVDDALAKLAAGDPSVRREAARYPSGPAAEALTRFEATEQAAGRETS
jgi:hypothetical protein